MGKQTELLELQAIDSAIDQLEKERGQIPERAQADELASEIAKVDAVLQQAKLQLHDAKRAQDKLDSEDATFNEKIEREEKKLYGGGVVNPKELEGIQGEITSLRKRRDELETSLLEAMQEVEDSRAREKEIRARKEEMSSRLEGLEDVFGSKAADLDAKLSEQGGLRQRTAKGVSAELLDSYEKVRSQKGGVAVGELKGDICGACRVELPAQELDRMRGGEGVWRCPQCRRILVERD